MATEQRPPAVELLSVEKSFQNGKQVLANVGLTIGADEFVSLIGPSGCGKSTLLALMSNLLEPSDGRIRWWRQDFTRIGGAGQRLAMVFQEATLMPWRRAIDNVLIALQLNGQHVPDALPRAQAALQGVGLGDRMERYPHELSGGQRMRVSIARAMVTEPDLLLMDEPFGALDELTRNRLDDELGAACAERSIACVFVTHSIYEAVFLSRRVIVMAANPGRIHAELVIDVPQPRTDAFRETEEFADYCRRLLRLLKAASAANES